MILVDLLSDLDVLYQRVLIVLAVLVGISLAAFILALLYTQRRGGARARWLADRFKTRQRRRSRKELRALAQGESVVLGKNLQVWPRQDVILPATARCLNVLNMGPVGVGKTAFFLNFIAQDMTRPEVALVIFDGQHDLTEAVRALAMQYQREVVIYPEVGFNPLAGPGGPQERAALFADLFGQVSEVGSEGTPLYYLQKAQSFIRRVIPLYERAYQQPMMVRELLELCVSEETRDRLLAAAAGSPEARDYGLVCRGWSRTDFEKNLAGLVNFLDRVSAGRNAHLYNQRFAPTLADCLEQKKVIVIREGGPAATQAHTTGLLYMVSLQEYAAHRTLTSSRHLVSLYMDEAHLYFNANFPTFIATARKRRVALHLGFQAFEQLAPFRQTITTNARTWVVHSGLLHADAQVVADNIGKRRFQTRSWSSTSFFKESRQTISHTWDHLVQPHEIRGLPADQALILTVEGRETAAHVLVRKPKLLDLTTTPYHEPNVPRYAPPTIWETQERGQHLADTERLPPSAAPQPGQRQIAADWEG
jgi:hypothetical protein